MEQALPKVDADVLQLVAQEKRQHDLVAIPLFDGLMAGEV